MNYKALKAICWMTATLIFGMTGCSHMNRQMNRQMGSMDERSPGVSIDEKGNSLIASFSNPGGLSLLYGNGKKSNLYQSGNWMSEKSIFAKGEDGIPKGTFFLGVDHKRGQSVIGYIPDYLPERNRQGGVENPCEIFDGCSGQFKGGKGFPNHIVVEAVYYCPEPIKLASENAEEDSTSNTKKICARYCKNECEEYTASSTNS